MFQNVLHSLRWYVLSAYANDYCRNEGTKSAGDPRAKALPTQRWPRSVPARCPMEHQHAQRSRETWAPEHRRWYTMCWTNLQCRPWLLVDSFFWNCNRTCFQSHLVWGCMGAWGSTLWTNFGTSAVLNGSLQHGQGTEAVNKQDCNMLQHSIVQLCSKELQEWACLNHTQQDPVRQWNLAKLHGLTLGPHTGWPNQSSGTMWHYDIHPESGERRKNRVVIRLAGISVPTGGALVMSRKCCKILSLNQCWPLLQLWKHFEWDRSFHPQFEPRTTMHQLLRTLNTFEHHQAQKSPQIREPEYQKAHQTIVLETTRSSRVD